MPNRLLHDEAFALARALVGRIRHLLREEEIADAFGEFYRLATTAIQHYAEAVERKRKRLRPEEGGRESASRDAGGRARLGVEQPDL